MVVRHYSFKVRNDRNKPMFHDITDQIKNFVSDSSIRDGVAIIYSQHTTCSVIIQEESHDTIYDGTKFILQDLLDIFEE
ncbi:MAG: YjbQ family protein, partial [Candidatus Humimicrobiaceae bacterium]